MATREKICSQPFKNTCEGAIAKVYYVWFTILHMKLSGTRNFCMLSKLSEQFLSNYHSSLLHLCQAQNSYHSIYLTYSISLFVRQFILISLRIPVPQVNAKTLQVKQSWEEWNNWNYILFLQNYLSPVDSERKILKRRLSSAGVVPPNQRCRQRNICLRELNEEKDFFSRFILVTRQRKGWGKKLCSVILYSFTRKDI